MAKRKPIRLTKSEKMFMEILWEAGRPLSRPEVVDLARKDHGVNMPMSTFHLLVNHLLELDYIAVAADLVGHVKRHTRHCIPKITRNEHFALQIAHSEKFSPSDIPAIVCALFRMANVKDPEPYLQEIRAELSKA